MVESILLLATHLAVTLWPHLKKALEDNAKTEGQKLVTGWWTQQREEAHLKEALKKAVVKGVNGLDTVEDKHMYLAFISVLCESEANLMRAEALTLFTDNQHDYATLIHKYNLRERIHTAWLEYSTTINSTPKQKDVTEEEATRYLKSFFSALRDLLFEDPLLKSKIVEATSFIANKTIIQTPEHLKAINKSVQHLDNAVESGLRDILEQLKHQSPDYAKDQCERDLQRYLEIVMNNHSQIYIPTEEKNAELTKVFVPQSIKDKPQEGTEGTEYKSTFKLLEDQSKVVLLGNVGTGKTTNMHYLAWSHASARVANTTPSAPYEALSSRPIPLFIRLSKFAEYRVQEPGLNFFGYVAKDFLEKREWSKMFDLLAANNTPLLFLLDGLDEVTENKRRDIIEAIENQAQNDSYYILVTSRPERKGLSVTGRSFLHVCIQGFTNEQIETFVENSYLSMSHSGKLTYEEERTKKQLCERLLHDTNLHPLAKNPLLLTIITRISRRRQLPEKRHLIYKECIDWLLEIWAQHRGTGERLKEMKMSEREQRACLACLGFLLHEQMCNSMHTSEEGFMNDEASSNDIHAMVVDFLTKQDLFTPAKREAEADCFLQLVKEETSLITQRIDTISEREYYSFTHSAFREYFAALHITQRMRAEARKKSIENEVFTTFFVPYLYDLDWKEVILLLFKELESEEVTTLLRQILHPHIQYLQWRYNDITQRNLFFVCDRLIEDIIVSDSLAKEIVESMQKLILTSWYRSHRSRAIEALRRLMDTHQYNEKAKNALFSLLTLQHAYTALSAIIEVAQAFSIGSSTNENDSKHRDDVLERLLDIVDQAKELSTIINIAYFYRDAFAPDNPKRIKAEQRFLAKAQEPDILFEDAVRMLQQLLEYPRITDQEAQPIITLLLSMAQHAVTLDQARTVVEALSSTTVQAVILEQVPTTAESHSSTIRTQSNIQSWETAVDVLLTFMQRANFDELVVATETIYKVLIRSPKRDIAVNMLLNYRQERTFENVMSLASALSWNGNDTETANERQIIIGILQAIRQKYFDKLSFEQRVKLLTMLYDVSPALSQEQQEATQSFLSLLDHLTNLTIEDVQALYDPIPFKNKEWRQFAQQATKLLLADKSKRDSFQHMIQAAHILIMSSFFDREEKAQVAQELLSLIQKVGLAPDDSVDGATAAYCLSTDTSIQRQQAYLHLVKLAEDINTPPQLRLKAACAPFSVHDANFADRVQMMKLIEALVQGGVVQEAEAKQSITDSWKWVSYTYEQQVQATDIPNIYELAQNSQLPDMAREEMYNILIDVLPPFDVTI